jgi:formylglycine-generating enzyme required for sulfatase activity
MTTANGIGIKAMKNGSGIIVRTASPAFGKVDVYKMNGRMVASRMLDKACPADYAIAFGKAGAEAYVVKVTTGNQTCISRFVPGIGASGSAIANGKTGISAAALGKRTAVSDSVVAFARGFKTAVQAITAYEKTGVDFSLSACSLWVPTGALTHKKSMVKISAKGYNFEMGQSDIKALGVDANGYMNAEFELPPHNVTFARDFWMDTTEVTQGEFDRLMKKYYPTYAEMGRHPWHRG